MEISGRQRVRRFRMRFRQDQSTESDTNSSCCYRDFKISIFNEPIYRLGQRFPTLLKLWFSIGLGFGLASLTLVSIFLLFQFHSNPFSKLLASSIFGVSPSLSGIGYVLVSTVVTVSVHELGHALAAASEGIQMEYVAVFVAAIFPGGLVAFDNDVLQSLPSFNALRIYCAGIWHNAVFCAFCAFGLFMLPVMLSPLYKHGESLTVVDVPSVSPLFGYLSPGDVIVSLDGIRIHKPSEWIELAAVLEKQNSETSKNGSLYLGGSRRFHHGKGYCVPMSVIEEGFKGKMVENQFVCPGDLTAFRPLPCSNTVVREDSVCLDAKDIVKLNKCGDGWVTTSDTDNKNDCVCSQGESCLHAVQSPGVSWTEITYRKSSSRDCSRLGVEFNASNCLGTFVFVGDLIAMSHSVHLTAYQPRWLFNFGKSFPDILEKGLTCTFHVSLALVLLNSLPVYYLDGESILESSLQYFTLLSPRKKKKALQVCLIVGSLLSLFAFFKVFLIGLPLSGW